MDKTIRRIKLSTTKDEHGSFYSIIFENQFAFVRFYDGRTGQQRYIHQSYPMGLENLAEIFAEIDAFEALDSYFQEADEDEE